MALDWRAFARRLHFPACLATMAITSALVFSPAAQPWTQPYCLMPVLAWAAIGFTWRGTLSALAIMLAGATLGANPYAMRITDPSFAVFVLAQALVVAGGFGVGVAIVTSMQRRTAAGIADLLATINLGIFISRELGGKILFWSHGAERLYGWTAQEAIGRISHELLQTIHPIPLAEIEAVVMDAGEWSGDLQHTTKDGRHLIVAARKVRRTMTNGGIVTLLEVLHDVTEERRDQAALADLAHDLETRVAIEIAAREAVQDRVKRTAHIHALGKIAAGVAHEFNNILQAVIGGLELIEYRPNDAERVARLARTALSATERGAIITRRLLAFAGRVTFTPETIDPALVLDALHDVLTHTLGGRHPVHLSLGASLPALVVDKTEFETALVNLATNARDAMPDGGTILLSAVVDTIDGTALHPTGLPPARYLRVALCDDGRGMDAATLARAVDPFFTTKAVGAGTGLGLSMVKGFARQSGGELVLESAPGAGTTATLWLPVTDLAAPPLPRRPVTAEPAVPHQTGWRVLLVDDEALVRDTLADSLEHAGFLALVASGGPEALALLRADERVDLLISDYAMPDMDGLTVLRAARALRPNLPVLLLTGYVEAVSPGGLDDVGPFTVLRKPIAARQLTAAINAALALKDQNG